MKLISLTSLVACVALCAHAGPAPLKPPKHGGVYVVAHRGAHLDIPENTLPAYQKAIDLGVDFVEIDVRTTKDGKFISMHNDTVDSYAKGATGRARDLTLDELRALDIGERVGPKWKGAKIPTFEEILDLCKGKVGIYLDLKDAEIEQLVPLISARGMEHDVIWYIGGGMVPKLHGACPECIEMPDPGVEMLLSTLIEAVKPRVVAGTWKHFSKSFAEKCHGAGAIVIVDDGGPECWSKLVEWGADGIQTDHPADLIKFLEEHGKQTTSTADKSDGIRKRLSDLYIAAAGKLLTKPGERLMTELYDEFFREAKLDQGRERKVREILVAFHSKGLALGWKEMLKGTHTDPRAAKQAEELRSEMERRTGEVLSPEEMSLFRRYNQPEAFAQREKAKMSSLTFPTLAPDKAQMATQVIEEELGRFAEDPFDFLGDEEHMQAVAKRINDRLAQEFSPAELAVVNGFLNQMGTVVRNAMSETQRTDPSMRGNAMDGKFSSPKPATTP